MTIKSDYEARLDGVRALMHTHGLDFLVVGPSADMIYLTGARSRPSERLAAFVLPLLGPGYFITPAFEAASLPELPEGTQLKTWGETDNPAAMAASIIADSLHSGPGGANCTIGVAERLWSVFLLRLQAELPRASFTPATTVLSAARQVKTAGEVAAMQKAGAASDDAFAEFVATDFTGKSELQLSAIFADLLKARGAKLDDSPLIASGPNGASPHHHSGQRIVQEGDAIVLDFWGTVDDYTFDCTRTVFVGGVPAPDSEEAQVYGIVARAQEAAVQAARSGMTCEALDRVARGIITEAGYGEYFTHRLGHGIGLDTHEAPFIVAGNDTILQDGMSFSIEPGIYMSGKFGVRVEDCVALVDGKAVRLNNADHGIISVR
jgi:Xaa-Pro aminopeptidase